MTADPDLGRRLADHFADEAPRLAPDWILPSALVTIEATPQRRGLLAPWRFNPMPKYARLGAAAVALVAVLAVAFWQLNSFGVGHATSTPTPSPSTQASQSPAGYTVPPLTQTFTSTIYGLSISYPQGWKASAGTTPWTFDAGAYREPLGDLIEDPARENLFLKLASQPLGGTAFDQWAATVLAGRGCTGAASSIVIGGANGLVNGSCYTAVVASGDRGYLIGAHWNADLPELRSVGWVGWFQDVLATVHLDPAKAVDTR
jgi:hypothetical protein